MTPLAVFAFIVMPGVIVLLGWGAVRLAEHDIKFVVRDGAPTTEKATPVGPAQ